MYSQWLLVSYSNVSSSNYLRRFLSYPKKESNTLDTWNMSHLTIRYFIYIYVYIKFVRRNFEKLSEEFFSGLTFQRREGTKAQISQMIWSTEFSILETAWLECLQSLVLTLLSLDQRVYNPFDVLDHSLFVLQQECPRHKTPKYQKQSFL